MSISCWLQVIEFTPVGIIIAWNCSKITRSIWTSEYECSLMCCYGRISVDASKIYSELLKLSLVTQLWLTKFDKEVLQFLSMYWFGNHTSQLCLYNLSIHLPPMDYYQWSPRKWNGVRALNRHDCDKQIHRNWNIRFLWIFECNIWITFRISFFLQLKNIAKFARPAESMFRKLLDRIHNSDRPFASAHSQRFLRPLCYF